MKNTCAEGFALEGRAARRSITFVVAMACMAVLIGTSPSVRAAEAAAPAPNPFFGTWSDGLSMDPADSKRELDRQKSAGVGLIRQYVWWYRIEKSEHVYDWSRMDQLVKDASTRGLERA